LDTNRHHEKHGTDSFDENDVYGAKKDELEMDSDVNEDQNRERLLDDSFAAFVRSLNE